MDDIYYIARAEKYPAFMGMLKRAQIEKRGEFGANKMGNKVKTEGHRRILRMATRRECAKNKQAMIDAYFDSYQTIEIEEDRNIAMIERTTFHSSVAALKFEEDFSCLPAEEIPSVIGKQKLAQIENGAEFGVRRMGKVKTENPKKVQKMAVRRSYARSKQAIIDAQYDSYICDETE